MRRFLTLMPIALLVAVGIAACGAGDSDSFFESGGEAASSDAVTTSGSRGIAPQVAPAPPFAEAQAEEAFAPGDFEDADDFAAPAAAIPLPAGAPEPGPDGTGTDGALQVVERQVISTGFVNIEVETIAPAVSAVQQVAESLGGFVENSSLEGDEDQGFANLTIRVPQDQFFEALERIRRLGEVRSESLSAQDVTEQFIDLEARLNSALRAEESLLTLLGRAADINDVLSIERELTRIRSEIERLQGQLNFLERRVALATLSVSLFTPGTVRTEPPSASYGVDVKDVARAIDEVEAVAASVEGLVDASVVTISDAETSGFVAIRVPRDDFERAVTAVEAIGDVQTKTVRTGERSDDPEAAFSDEPDAFIEVRLREADGGTDAGLIAAIVVPSVLGGLLLLGVSFRLGRGRKA